MFLRDTLSIFFKDNYLSMIDKHAYHQLHFFLLGENETEKDRKTALQLEDVEITRDNVEIFLFKFDN